MSINDFNQPSNKTSDLPPFHVYSSSHENNHMIFMELMHTNKAKSNHRINGNDENIREDLLRNINSSSSSSINKKLESIFFTYYYEESKDFDFSQSILYGVEGKGGFANVFRIFDYNIMDEYIVKLDWNSLIEQNTEAKVYKMLYLAGRKHPNLINIIGAGITHEKRQLSRAKPLKDTLNHINKMQSNNERHTCQFFIIEPAICSLRDIIDYRKKEGIKWTQQEILHVLLSIVNGLYFLKDLGIAHRDIKPENILIIEDKDVNVIWKLADFGLCNIFEKDELRLVFREEVGTRGYIAPELLKKKGEYTNEMVNPFLCDIYSLGVTILHLLNLTPASFTRKAHENEGYGAIIDSQVVNLLKMMINDMPEKRPSLEDIRSILNELQPMPHIFLIAVQNVISDALASRISKLKNDALKSKDTPELQGIPGLQDGFPQLLLGMLYSRGNGVKQDIHEAIKWYKESAGQGNTVANQKLGYLLLSGIPVNDINFKEGILLYEEAIKEASPEGHLHTANLYNNLAGLLFNLGYYKKTEEYLQKALRIESKISNSMHPLVALLYHNFAGLYRVLGDYQKALKFQLKALTMRQIILGDEHLDTSMSYDNIGILYCDLGSFIEAKECCLKAFNIRKRLYHNNNDPSIAISLSNIGYVHYQLGDYFKAEKYYSESLILHERFFGYNHPNTAILCMNFGILYHKLRKFQLAQQYFLKSEQERLNDVGIDSLRLYNNIGALYQDMGNGQKAEEYYLKSLVIGMPAIGECHPLIANTYKNIGTLYYSRGDRIKAKELFEKAIKMHKEKLGDNCLELSWVYNDIGKLHEDEGEYEKAKEYYMKSLLIRQIVLGHYHPDTLHCYESLGTFYEGLKEYEAAKDFYLKAFKIRETALSNHHKTQSKLESDLGGLYLDTEDFNGVKEYYPEPYACHSMDPNSNDIDNLILCRQLGELFLKLKDFKSAKDYFIKSLKFQIVLFGKASPFIGLTLCLIGGICYITGDDKQAKAWLKIALNFKKNTLDNNNFDEENPIEKYATLEMLNNIGEEFQAFIMSMF